MTNTQKTLRVFMAVLAVIAGSLVVIRFLYSVKRRPPSTSFVMPNTKGSLPDFSFTERSGRTVTLADLRGKVWVADFIFTRCPGPCPMITSQMAKLSKQFNDTPNLLFVSFTVDPDHDTPEILRNYADLYAAPKDRWLFLTGTRTEIASLVGNGFRLGIQMGDTPDSVTHSTFLALVDKNAQVVGYFSSTNRTDLKELTNKIKQLL